MRRDRLAAQFAALLKRLLPACLSVSRVGWRGKGGHSLSNLKPRVNPYLLLPLQARQGLACYTDSPFLLLCGGVTKALLQVIFLFRVKAEAKPDLALPSWQMFVASAQEKEEEKEARETKRSHTCQVSGLCKIEKPTFAFRFCWVAVTLLSARVTHPAPPISPV